MDAFETRCEVRWADLDPNGHVRHTVFMDWATQCRVAALAAAGLTPRRFQSGAMDRSGRISKRGSRLLRWALNQAAWAAVRSRPEWRALFLRLGGGSKKRRKQAIVAVMRRLLVVAWAVLRDGTVYRSGRLQPKVAAAA